MENKLLLAKAIELCKPVLRMTTRAGAGHPSSALSLAHIVTALMYHQMRYDPAKPFQRHADRLVLSEGHAVPIIYAAYADLGGAVGKDPQHLNSLAIEDTDHLRELSSVLDGHPNPAEGFPFFDAATGSLGMGLSVAAGLALAARLDQLDRRIYCIIGDGESREGQIAEALDFIVDYQLTTVCPLFNANGDGQAGKVSRQQSPEVLANKLQAYGFKTRIIDGHNIDEISSALSAFEESSTPFAIIAKTIKGWGVTQLQDGNFHGKPLKEDDMPDAMASLDQMHERLGTSAQDASAVVQDPLPDKDSPPAAKRISLPDFEEVLRTAPFSNALTTRKLATRRAYGMALTALADADERIVALDGDVSNSTFSELFAAGHPRRFFEGKIAEQNLISVAVGLAAGGKIPFVSSFGKFIARAYDQVELAAISRANIKIVGSHSGLGPASDGPSQMSLADIAFFYSLGSADAGSSRPACYLFQPADAVAAYRLTELMAQIEGMCYLRTHRPDTPFVYDASQQFVCGGANVLATGDAVTIVCSGITVTEALAARETLSTAGIACAVIDAYSLPLKPEPILQTAAQTGGRILVVEDNYAGGFGSAVADIAAAHGGFTVRQSCVSCIPKSARKPEQLMAQFGVSADGICATVREMTGA